MKSTPDPNSQNFFGGDFPIFSSQASDYRLSISIRQLSNLGQMRPYYHCGRYTAYTTLYLYLRNSLTDQELAYLCQRDLSAISGSMALSTWDWFARHQLHSTLCLVRYFYLGYTIMHFCTLYMIIH